MIKWLKKKINQYKQKQIESKRISDAFIKEHKKLYMAFWVSEFYCLAVYIPVCLLPENSIIAWLLAIPCILAAAIVIVFIKKLNAFEKESKAKKALDALNKLTIENYYKVFRSGSEGVLIITEQNDNESIKQWRKE